MPPLTVASSDAIFNLGTLRSSAAFSIDPTAATNASDKMPAKKGDEAGESSTSAAKKILTANTNGSPNYELPW